MTEAEVELVKMPKYFINVHGASKFTWYGVIDISGHWSHTYFFCNLSWALIGLGSQEVCPG